MKAVVFGGSKTLRFDEFEDPTPGFGEVVIEVKASGMCGSDLHAYRAPLDANRRPVIAGHEPAGIVAAVGPGVPPNVAKLRDRVMVHHYYGCTTCNHCRGGWTQLCKTGTMQLYGSNADGSHAPYMKIPASILIPLHEGLSFKAGAAISCGTGTAWGGLKRLGATGADTLVVFGQGPVGLSATMLASAMGCRVIAVDIDEGRLNLAKQFGAHEVVNASTEPVVERIKSMTGGKGASMAFETSGNSAAASNAIDSVDVWGKVCFAGIGATVKFDVLAQLGKQLNLMTTWSMSSIGQKECADFIVERSLDIDGIYSDVWRLDQAVEAYEKFDKQASGKGVFLF